MFACRHFGELQFTHRCIKTGNALCYRRDECNTMPSYYMFVFFLVSSYYRHCCCLLLYLGAQELILQQQCYVYILHFPYFRRFRFFRSCCCFAAFHSVLLLVSVSMYRRLKRNTLDSCIRSELKESYVCFWVHIDMPICAPQWSWKWKDNSTKGAFRLMDAEMRNSEFILTGSEMPKDMVPSWWNNIHIFGICEWSR